MCGFYIYYKINIRKEVKEGEREEAAVLLTEVKE